MDKSKRINVSREEIVEVLVNWIKESDRKTIQRIFNENFEEEIRCILPGLFDIPISEAERIGIVAPE